MAGFAIFIMYNICYPDDKLFRDVPGVPSGVEVVKETDKDTRIREFHSSSIGGHSGVNKTIAALKTNYWWLGLTDDVKTFVSLFVCLFLVKYRPCGNILLQYCCSILTFAALFYLHAKSSIWDKYCNIDTLEFPCKLDFHMQQWLFKQY